MCFRETITARWSLPRSVPGQSATLPSLPSFVSSFLNSDSSHLDVKGCVISNLLSNLCISFKEINANVNVKWLLGLLQNLEATYPLCYIVEMEGVLGLDPRQLWECTCGPTLQQQPLQEEIWCCEFASVWAHTYLHIQVRPGELQSSAGA